MEYVEVSDFKGLNTARSSTEIDDNEAQVCDNVVLDNPIGAIKKRSGTTRFGNDFADKKITALYPFYYASGTKKFIAVAGTDAYVEGSGTWTAQSQTLTEDAEPHFATFIDSASAETAIMVNGNQTKDYTGSAWNDLGGSPPASTKYIHVFQDRVYLANDGGSNLNRVWFSAVGDSESWDTGAGGDFFNVPAIKDGDDITGIFEHQRRLIIFKRYSIWAWDGNQLRNITKRVGCISQNSVAKSENFLYFLSYVDGIKVFSLSGEFLTDIGSRIQTDLDTLATGQLGSAAGAYFNSRYYLSVPEAAQTTNTAIYVYQEKAAYADGTGTWSKYTNIKANVLSVFRTSNTEELYYGEATANSLVITMETGTADWSASSNAADALISAKWHGKDFGNAASFNHYNKFYATYASQTPDSFLRVTGNINQGEQKITQSLQMKGIGPLFNDGKLYDNGEFYGGLLTLDGSFRITGRGKFLRIEIENIRASQPFKVFTFGFSFEPLIPR